MSLVKAYFVVNDWSDIGFFTKRFMTHMDVFFPAKEERFLKDVALKFLRFS